MRLRSSQCGETRTENLLIDEPLAVGDMKCNAVAFWLDLLATVDTDKLSLHWDATTPLKVSTFRGPIAPLVPAEQFGPAYGTLFGKHHVMCKVKAIEAVPFLRLEWVKIETARNIKLRRDFLQFPHEVLCRDEPESTDRRRDRVVPCHAVSL